MLGRRFERTGSMDDLDRAVEVVGEAVEVTPQDRPDRAGMLSNRVRHHPRDVREMPWPGRHELWGYKNYTKLKESHLMLANRLEDIAANKSRRNFVLPNQKLQHARRSYSLLVCQARGSKANKKTFQRMKFIAIQKGFGVIGFPCCLINPHLRLVVGHHKSR